MRSFHSAKPIDIGLFIKLAIVGLTDISFAFIFIEFFNLRVVAIILFYPDFLPYPLASQYFRPYIVNCIHLSFANIPSYL